jgi:Carbohydrate binding domain/Glycosyl hydrolase family 26
MNKSLLCKLTLVLSVAALFGCGGDKTKPPKVVSSSSIAASSKQTASSAPASSAPASSVTASSSPASSTPSTSTNYRLKIDITKAGVEIWQPQVFQPIPTGVVANKDYILSYRIKASDTKKIQVKIDLGADSTPQYKGYPLDKLSEINVTTEWQTLSFTFTPTETDSGAQFQMNVGAQGAFQIWIDDISFKLADGSGEQITDGAMTDVTNWSYTINSGVGTATVNVVDENDLIIVPPKPVLIDFPVTKRSPLYNPTGDKTLLIMGQDLVALGDTTDGATVYADGFMDDNDLDDYPVGLTTYLEVQGTQGLTETFLNSGEIKNAELTANHRDFAGTKPLISIGYFIPVGGHARILSGANDVPLKALADWIKAKNAPTFLRIGYEFNASWTGHPSNKLGYMNSFRYIVSKLEAWGVTNCSFVWQSDGQGSAAELESFYPGDDYVDWLGYSHFTVFGSGIFEVATAHNKPIMIAEATPIDYNLAAAADANGQSAWNGWFAPLFAHIDSHPSIRALAYINDNWPAKPMWATNDYFKKTDSRIQKSPIVKANFIAEMNDGSWFTKADVMNAIGFTVPAAP